MPAIVQNIELETGADYEVEGYITDDYGKPVDISGDTFIGTVSDYCGGTVLASFVYSVALDSSDSIYKYTRAMPRATIDGIPNKTAYWEQYQISPDNLSTKNFSGNVKVKGKSTTVPA